MSVSAMISALRDSVRSRNGTVSLAISIMFAASLVVSCGVPLPQPADCRSPGLTSRAAQKCCSIFGINCFNEVASRQGTPNVLHVDPGRESLPRALIMRLGEDCTRKRTKCAKGLECRGGLCRKTGLSQEQLRFRKTVQKLKDNTPSFAKMGNIAAPEPPGKRPDMKDASKETGPMMEEQGIQVSGLSVPLSQRVPLNDMTSGSGGLLPVRQKMHKHIHVIGSTTRSDQSCDLAESNNKTCSNRKHVSKDERDSGASDDKRANEELDTPPSTDSSESKEANDSLVESRKLSPSLPAVNEETEDEQISDSVAKVVEKLTGITVDDSLLAALDAAVTEAMNKYEDQAIANGDLVVNVDNLIKGEGSADVRMKETEPVPEEDSDSIERSKAGLLKNPKNRVQLINEHILAAVRKRTEREMSPEFAERVAKLILDPRCSTKDENKSAEGTSAFDSRAGPPCEVVSWLRANLFSGRPGAQGDGSKSTASGEL